MKILRGDLQEQRYREAEPLEKQERLMYGENEVSYINSKQRRSTLRLMLTNLDRIGLHSVSNPDCNHYAMSLHCENRPSDELAKIQSNSLSVYNPPLTKCHIFELDGNKKEFALKL
jgi:hypothetical protein